MSEMTSSVRIGDREIGRGFPCFIVAEIGINHIGDLSVAKRLMDVARAAGCDAVKFQKRNPEKCVPPEQKGIALETPWGHMTYLEYRSRVELDGDAYKVIKEYCDQHGLLWFASSWDEDSLEFMEQFSPPCHKIPSACLTDLALLRQYRETGKTLILSTGMSTMDEIRAAVGALGRERLILLHCHSSYPANENEINLRVMATLEKEFGVPVGYSGHERGLQVSLAAVALGACMVERHITLDRTMWGSDQAASLEPHGLHKLVRDIRLIEKAMGDGLKRVYQSEVPVRNKLRRVRTES